MAFGQIDFGDCAKAWESLLIPRPNWSTKPAPDAIDRYILAHPTKYRETVEIAAKQLLVHVSQERFEQALYRSVDQLVEKLPDGATVIIFDDADFADRSNHWVTQLATKYLFDKHRDIGKKLKIRTVSQVSGLTNADLVVVFDDALFSGHQMAYEVLEPKVESTRLPYFKVAPYFTDDSSTHIDHSRLIGDTKMDTFGEEEFTEYWFNVFEEDQGSTLIVFDHLKPDEASSLKLRSRPHIQGVHTLIEGAVYRKGGIDFHRFIPNPDKPYRR